MSGALQYRQISAAASVQDASPHRLVQLMFDGVLTRLAAARGQIDRSDYQGKAKSLSGAVAILGGLQHSLDLEKGGDLARNLDGLYDYMQRQLFRANVDNDGKLIDEVTSLLLRVKSGWDAIGASPRGEK